MLWFGLDPFHVQFFKPLFKNILCYGSAANTVKNMEYVSKFKNILCYGSAGGAVQPREGSLFI